MCFFCLSCFRSFFSFPLFSPLLYICCHYILYNLFHILLFLYLIRFPCDTKLFEHISLNILHLATCLVGLIFCVFCTFYFHLSFAALLSIVFVYFVYSTSPVSPALQFRPTPQIRKKIPFHLES